MRHTLKLTIALLIVTLFWLPTSITDLLWMPYIISKIGYTLYILISIVLVILLLNSIPGKRIGDKVKIIKSEVGL